MPPIGDTRDLKSIVKEYIKKNNVAVFTKSTCPFCIQVKDLFNSLNIHYKDYELDKLDNGIEIQNVLFEISRQKTVPNVFIGGQHIGGYDNTAKLHSEGKLLLMIYGEIGKDMHNARDIQTLITESISKNKIMMFAKSYCPWCKKAKELLHNSNLKFDYIDVDLHDNGHLIQQALFEYSGQKTVPNIYISGNHIGGYDDLNKLHIDGKLLKMASEVPIELEISGTFDYDLIVIGGGSGGLAASKEAARLGQRVACLDFVKPSPQGSTWGLGGTCVNVGCIPKKLMHQAALLGKALKDARSFGWEFDDKVSHNWITMKSAIQDYIKSLNFNYRTQLRSKNVIYENSFGHFVGPHKIKCVNGKGVEKEMTSKYFIIATGGRPNYPTNVPGVKEYAITSDDLFSLPYPPGKTLTIGASYVSLECAGFLRAVGFDVTVMVRSIFLRGFDQQMAELVGAYMQEEGVKIVRPCVPTKIEKIADGQPGRYRVTGVNQDDLSEFVDEFNTIVVAIGRDPCTADLNLSSVGVKTNPRTGYVICGNDERTTCPYIFAVGDIVEGKPELTPVAIQAGQLLARRLFNNATLLCDYDKVPTTIFTPLEYGCIGFTEEEALLQFGSEDVAVYHSNFTPLEWQLPHNSPNACYAKLVCVKSQNERVVGFHVLGPNAGEITQGWAVGMKLNATKADFDATIGIHPTCAEVFTTLSISKESGDSTETQGC